MRSEQINEIAAALAKAQAVMQNAPMDRVNPHFHSKYATLASMLDAIRKPLSENGLAVTQIIGMNGDAGMILTTMLMHTSGQWLASEYPLPIGKPHDMGSAQTYARRYSLAALVCNSAEEDDDANAAQAQASDKTRISNEQIDTLKDLFAAIPDADVALQTAFLQAFGVKAYAEIPAREFERAVIALKAKAKSAKAAKPKPAP